ncbi:HPF/RaiA family ribosome-associated protein [Yeosuana marina]|jgi:ribosome-associated translation inhibitor RaiA|uniref:HPF/RaiA family ribosome-associated protein n=1 Tax=Yeosuana marina TaxID=1565536 RepID=UPI0030C876F7|tara:strand:- start:9284 stop:9598 length:315 start_codon:yes stop_codon:yes gene_type:complete
MNIQLNTDTNISGNERLENYINNTIIKELDRFSDHITRIEVHLSDENGSKNGQHDKRCLLEARLENRPPIAVTSNENTMEKAVSNSIKKLKRSMDTIYGRLMNR